jgi:hypothetical protein
MWSVCLGPFSLKALDGTELANSEGRLGQVLVTDENRGRQTSRGATLFMLCSNALWAGYQDG